MNKKLFVSALLVIVAVFSFTGVVAAQGQNPPETSPRNGYVHDILISYASEVLGLSVETIEARIEAGESLAQIAFAEGEEDFYSFMQEAKSYVSEQLAEQGISIPGWDKDNMRGNRAQNAQMGTCDGTCENGTGEPQGRGFRGGR